MVTSAFSQPLFWPSDLNVPRQPEPVVQDSAESSLILSSKVSLYQTMKTRSRLDWERHFSGGMLTQGVEHRYEQLNQSSIQFVDMSGMLLFNDVLIEGLDAGIDWSPIVSYSKWQAGILQSNADIGPVLKHSVFSVPYTVRGGIYGYAWSDTLRSLQTASVDDYQGNVVNNIGEVFMLRDLTPQHQHKGLTPVQVDVGCGTSEPADVGPAGRRHDMLQLID